MEAVEESFEIEIAPLGGWFRCRSDQTVLDAAVAAGYWLPHSCRSGTCGSCRVSMDSGGVRYADASMGASAIAETSAAQCLTCQAKPLSNLVLHVPNVPAEPGRRIVQAPARVLSTERPSADVVVVRLQVPPQAGFSFEPGQYAEVMLRDGARRSYSMANAPADDGVIEWHVRRVAGGRFSPHAFDKLKPRDVLRLEGPFGSFVLQRGDAPVIFLASGTGYAPVAAMLAAHGAELARRRAIVYWGGRSLSDLYCLQTHEKWQARHPGIRLVPVLTHPEQGWEGRMGLVHRAVLADWPDLSARHVYACGNPAMVDAARRDFEVEAGLLPEHFHSDSFVFRS